MLQTSLCSRNISAKFISNFQANALEFLKNTEEKVYSVLEINIK